MRRKALILVEGHRGNGPLHIQAARRLGLHPITLAVDPAQYEYLGAESVDAIPIDTGNIDALIRECYRLRITYDIAGITAFAGDDVSVSATVGKLCRHFGLPGPNPVSIEQCCDKFVQRQLLSEAGVSVPAYHMAANAMEVERFANALGVPVVVKGSGSTGAKLCRNVDDLAAHSAILWSINHITRSSRRILVEEFTQGSHFSINMMGNEVIGIAALDFCQAPDLICRECTYPAVLTENEHDSIADVSLNCLRALGLGWGPTTIELGLTKRGPVVIGVSPHLPGSPAPELVQLVYGVDLVTEHIKLVTGAQRSLRRSPTNTAAARFLVPDLDGTLDWIDGDSRAAAVSGIAEVELYIEPKTRVPRKGGHRECIGHVIAVSSNHAQTQTTLQRAADLIHWSITPHSDLGE
ncbi:ATP-grasp domain-containing protein [Mesorhizobium sp. M0965]|uniref:ATP-grasp domain-containing protein n=1 Tax=Mesorhizobium sp. M0965 TaxID=2957036 RepID=UPI00333DDD62